MFYLIGAAHRAHLIGESGLRTDAHEAFYKCLEAAIADHRPVLVAEEANPEKLKKYKQLSLAKIIGDAERLEHMFCDPSDREREEMGYKDRLDIGLDLARTANLSSVELDAKAGAIEIARYFPMRERFWFERLSGYHKKDVIFICGDYHVDRFAKLLDKAGITHKTVQREIGVNDEDIRRMRLQKNICRHTRSYTTSLQNQIETARLSYGNPDCAYFMPVFVIAVITHSESLHFAWGLTRSRVLTNHSYPFSTGLMPPSKRQTPLTRVLIAG
jgi:hypothetical protein